MNQDEGSRTCTTLDRSRSGVNLPVLQLAVQPLCAVIQVKGEYAGERLNGRWMCTEPLSRAMCGALVKREAESDSTRSRLNGLVHSDTFWSHLIIATVVIIGYRERLHRLSHHNLTRAEGIERYGQRSENHNKFRSEISPSGIFS